MGKINRIEMTIRCEVGKEVEIGEMICGDLRRNPDYVKNKVLVNYTMTPGTVYVVIGVDAMPTKVNWTL